MVIHVRGGRYSTRRRLTLHDPTTVICADATRPSSRTVWSLFNTPVGFGASPQASAVYGPDLRMEAAFRRFPVRICGWKLLSRVSRPASPDGSCSPAFPARHLRMEAALPRLPLGIFGWKLLSRVSRAASPDGSCSPTFPARHLRMEAALPRFPRSISGWKLLSRVSRAASPDGSCPPAFPAQHLRMEAVLPRFPLSNLRWKLSFPRFLGSISWMDAVLRRFLCRICKNHMRSG